MVHEQGLMGSQEGSAAVMAFFVAAARGVDTG